ncbi:DUF2716 domain-containing protein [Kineococcus radiotolerans]|uniref:DUF2716 domain-containing protein n=1 Tax=Kineococcus radiotolerans (strain ATCC BAA-149 / DSM 14245 / SRS30216) TaxID=266940 RepID=A6WAK0_KINRD|nr:DUF2716 domain-containing protein [Kineococcus radiotolerans]ABS03839.1 conserved hypothetical protein [Kineococcus radiotolerans SRS30216 = ATCC BAA-149]
MSDLPAEPPAPTQQAWTELTHTDHQQAWAAFHARYHFRASPHPEDWPAIHEPTPSLTFDLTAINDGAQRAAAYDAINAEALRCFLWALHDVDELLVLDWQHPTHILRPHQQALTDPTHWQVPVYPDGDYCAFFTPDLTEGTFGHPWEKSLCVIGPRLIDSLGRSLSTWLPLLRQDGQLMHERSR